MAIGVVNMPKSLDSDKISEQTIFVFFIVFFWCIS